MQRRYNTHNNTKTQNTQQKTNIQNKKTNKKRILKKVSRVIRKYQREANNNETKYYTEPTYVTPTSPILAMYVTVDL